jgi:hypothetical protein
MEGDMHEHERTTRSLVKQAALPGGERDEPKDSRRNQRERILQMLLDAAGSWVRSQDLVAVSCQYSSRIFELRHRYGWSIDNRVTRDERGRKLGFFRIQRFVSVENGALDTKPARTTTTANQDGDTPLLFTREAMESCVAPRQHRDEG